MGFLSLDDLTGTIEVTAFSDTYEKYNAYLQKDAIVLIKGTVDFGAGRAKTSSDDEEEERPEAKLLAIAVAPVDDPEAIRTLQAAARRRSNGYNRNQSASPAVALPTYKPTFRQPQKPAETPAGGIPMSTNETTPPAPPAEPVSQPSCRVCVTEDFLKSEQFDTLPSLLQTCRGDMPLEISVALANGQRRRWRIANLRVSPTHVEKFISRIPGTSMES